MKVIISLFALAVVFFLSVLALIVVIGYGTYLYYLPTFSDKEKLVNNNSSGLTLLDDAGEEFFTFYNANDGEYIDIDEIPDTAELAAISSEDKEFNNHRGFSVKGIVRAALLNIENGNISYGGSTITQQLVKNTLLSPERSFMRKFQEVVLAIAVEERYSKDEIMEMYLNTAYFGENAFGIEEASNVYFSKEAKDLNLAEASFLIGLLTSPSTLSPYLGNRDLAIQRQKEIISQMADDGYIAQDEKAEALAYTLSFSTSPDDLNIIAPHFALYVRDKLIDEFGEQEVLHSGFKVKTTLNRQMQSTAEEKLEGNYSYLVRNGGTNGAVVVINAETSEVKAMVGSISWSNDEFGKVNMAISPRQPGSSFKPIVYAEAFQNGYITPATVLQDRRTTFRMENCTVNCEYRPNNYDRRYRGSVTVRQALSNSLNIPAVEVMEEVGVDKVLAKAERVGIESLGTDSSKYGLSLVLGAGEVSLLEMTNAYASFANEGEFKEAKVITEITDKRENKVAVSESPGNSPWSPQVAFLISSILSDSRARAQMFGSSLNISRPAAVKTGTTDSYRDAWTIGYTPDYVVGVWVGNNDNRPMNRVAGSLGAAPIWRQVMEEIHAGLVAKEFEPPANLVSVPFCSSSRVEYFLSGTEPGRRCIPALSIARASSSAELNENEPGSEGVGGAPPTATPEQN